MIIDNCKMRKQAWNKIHQVHMQIYNSKSISDIYSNFNVKFREFLEVHFRQAIYHLCPDNSVYIYIFHNYFCKWIYNHKLGGDALDWHLFPLNLTFNNEVCCFHVFDNLLLLPHLNAIVLPLFFHMIHLVERMLKWWLMHLILIL